MHSRVLRKFREIQIMGVVDIVVFDIVLITPIVVVVIESSAD